MRRKLIALIIALSALLLAAVAGNVYLESHDMEAALQRFTQKTESLEYSNTGDSTITESADEASEISIPETATSGTAESAAEPSEESERQFSQAGESERRFSQTEGTESSYRDNTPFSVYIPSETGYAEPEPISFPYAVPGTTLVIQSLECYDGIFLEDGSDREIEGITAAVITNVGGNPVEYAEVRLASETECLEFAVTALGTDDTVIVQENNAALYTSNNYYECSARASCIAYLQMSSDLVEVKEAENGSLEVINISGEIIPCTRVFYKFYMDDVDVYVGGITYNIKILNLFPGQIQTVIPSHYIAGYSKIVMIKTYNEEN